MKKFRKLHSLIAMVLISVLLVGDLSPAIPVYAEDVSAADTVSRVDPLVYDFEFLSTPVDGTVYDKPVTAGWTVESGASKTTTVEDSLWKINVEAASYTLQGEKNVAIESALYPSFRMSVLNKTAATKATLFFTTDADTSYTNTKSLSLNIQPNDTVYREYMFDMSTVSSWSGIIGQVKIVFESASGEAGGQLNVDYFSFAPNTVPADVIFDISEGQECIENVIFAVQGGDDALVLTPTGPNASFETVDNLGLDAAQFNYFKISLQNSSSAKRLRVSFITESSPVWNTEKSVLLDELKTSDSGLSYYAFNMSSCGMWQGRIRKLRVTFEDSAFNDSNITVTAIGIFTGVILEDQVFDFTSSHEGWTAGKNTALSQKNNSLTVNISGKDAYYCSPEVYINADEMRYITLKLKNATASSAMRIQWANDGDDGFNDIKSQNIVIKSNSPMQEYVVALGDHQRWEGIVTGLKITPALYATKGSVQLSSIAFSQNEDTSFSGREITEGSMESSYMNGWTVNRNGGSVTGQNDKKGTGKYPSNGSGMTLELTNKGPYNNTLGQGSPTEAWRSVPKYEDGFIKWSVNVNISDVNTTGNSIRLINTQNGKDAISLTFDSGFARAALSSGEQLIASISNSATLKFTLYMNMAEHTYDVYINSILKASKVPFTNAESFDKLYIGTTGEHKVVFGYSGSLYRINELYEDFSQFTAGNVIDGLYTADGSVVVGNVSSKKLPLTIYPEGYSYTSLLAVGNNTASSFKANFVPASNVIEANVAFAVMEKADGMKIALQDGSSDAAAIKISGNDIVYTDQNGNAKVLWKKFKTNVRYSLKIRVYTELNKVEYSVNGCSSKNGGTENVNTPAETALISGTDTLDAINISTSGEGIWYIDELRILDYTPSTVPTIEATNDTANGYVGVNGWVANTEASDRFYEKSQRIADKESVLGYFDDENKTAADWQIKYLAENGVDFLSYFFIGFQGNSPVDTYIDYADHKNMINFAYCLDYWAANTATDYENKIWPFLSERMFRNPNYVSFEGKPILFAFSNLYGWSTEVAMRLKELAVADGFDGLILVNVINSDNPLSAASAALEKGYDYFTQYWKVTSPSKVDTYVNAGKKAGIDYIISPGTGADSRCWSEITQSPFPFIYTTPSEFYNTLNYSAEAMKDYSSASLASKMIFAENWSEFAEGHSIMPFGEYGFAYINQIRRVFGSKADNNHKNTVPSGKLNLKHSKSWNKEQLSDRGFETGAGDWKTDKAELAVVASKEFSYLKASANVINRQSADSSIYQDITSTILNNGKGAVYDMSAYLMANSSTFVPFNDELRYMSFLTSSNQSVALTYSSSSEKLITAAFDENNTAQRFAVRKVKGTKYYQIYLADGYAEDANGNVVSGKLIVSAKDWPDKNMETVYLAASLYVRDISQITSENIEFSYFSIPSEIFERDVISINAGPMHDSRVLFQTTGIGNAVRLILNWNDATQRWRVKYRSPSTEPIWFRTAARISLEITDSAGTHSYTYNGSSTLGETVNNVSQIKVDWTGELKKAELHINGDAISTENFAVDECRFQLVPKQYYSLPSYVIVNYSAADLENSKPCDGSTVFNKTRFSEEQSTWILKQTDTSGRYRLKNKATGLYLTMGHEDGRYRLYQSSDRGGHPSQVFALPFVSNYNGNKYYIICNIEFNMVIYSSDDGSKILFADFATWSSKPPQGASDNNRAQFIANLADGAENVIRMAGSYAYLQSNEGKAPEYTGDVVFDKTVSGTERSVWIFHKEANGYRLENKATGLYLTMERNSNGYKLYQASERGQNPSQIFDFLSYNIYSILYNVDLNVVIYSNAEGDGVLFQNKDTWWKAPEGTDDNNKCQFFLNNGIYDSAENVIKMEGGKAYLQCGNYMLPEIKGDLTFSKTQTSEELSIWKLQAVTNGYRLKNKATGLYMTMEAYGDTYRLFQASDRGIDDASQCFTFKKYNEYYFLCQADLNVVIYSDTNGNRILYQNYADWAVPPEGANSNNKCQFKLATAPKDKAEIVIKMSGNGAYLRAYMGTAFITAKADGNGIVSSAQKAEIGTNVTVTAKANNGYLFDGWYMDGERVADTASYTFTAQDNISVIARFRLFYGDIDFDGEITLYDVVAVRTELLTDNEYSAVYDVNQNGEFDICDLVRIKKILVGLV